MFAETVQSTNTLVSQMSPAEFQHTLDQVIAWFTWFKTLSPSVALIVAVTFLFKSKIGRNAFDTIIEVVNSGWATFRKRADREAGLVTETEDQTIKATPAAQPVPYTNGNGNGALAKVTDSLVDLIRSELAGLRADTVLGNRQVVEAISGLGKEIAAGLKETRHDNRNALEAAFGLKEGALAPAPDPKN